MIKGDRRVFAVMGATSHSEGFREENDYYATEPRATELLLEQEGFSHKILEPCAGGLHMVNVLRAYGYDVTASDLIPRADGVVEQDFLKIAQIDGDCDIITNPPYKYAEEFVRHALDLVSDGRKVAMFLKIQFLEGQSRKKLYAEHPPKTVYVASSRLTCAKNGRFDLSPGSAICFAWYVWEKGYKGEPHIRWIN